MNRGSAAAGNLPSVFGFMRHIFILVAALAQADGATAQVPPGILTQPASKIVATGFNTEFSVEVSGSGPFAYEWRLNGTNLPFLLTTKAGNGYQAEGEFGPEGGYGGDGGLAITAEFNGPCAVAVDAGGNLFVADASNNRVRRVDTNGFISTVAGNGAWGYSGDGGPALRAELNNPSGVAVDASGNVFIADSLNDCVREVGADGVIHTLAGTGVQGYSGDGGAATNAQFFGPAGVAVDAAGNLYIADALNNRVRKVDARGVITTIAGTGAYGYSGDGGAATNALLNEPLGVAVDRSGSLFIADAHNSVVRKIGAGGVITTVAGNGTYGYSGNGGLATNAAMSGVFGVAVDAAGNLFLVDNGNARIRKVGANAIITTVAGNGIVGYSGDSGPAVSASLNYPDGVAVDAAWNLFIADAGNQVVREVPAFGPTLRLIGVGPSNAGAYDVVVTSPFGSVTSVVATLTLGGSVPPSPGLELIRTPLQSMQLTLTGLAGVTYEVDISPNLQTWNAWTNVPGPVWMQPLPNPASLGRGDQFYRAKAVSQ